MEFFFEIIKSKSPVLVDFFAEWCGPCKMMKPILEEVKKMKGESIRILKIDIDRNKELSKRFVIQSVPTLLLFKDGNILWRQSGVIQANDLSQIISQYI